MPSLRLPTELSTLSVARQATSHGHETNKRSSTPFAARRRVRDSLNQYRSAFINLVHPLPQPPLSVSHTLFPWHSCYPVSIGLKQPDQNLCHRFRCYGVHTIYLPLITCSSATGLTRELLFIYRQHTSPTTNYARRIRLSKKAHRRNIEKVREMQISAIHSKKNPRRRNYRNRLLQTACKKLNTTIRRKHSARLLDVCLQTRALQSYSVMVLGAPRLQIVRMANADSRRLRQDESIRQIEVFITVPMNSFNEDPTTSPPMMWFGDGLISGHRVCKTLPLHDR